MDAVVNFSTPHSTCILSVFPLAPGINMQINPFISTRHALHMQAVGEDINPVNGPLLARSLLENQSIRINFG